MLCTNIISAVQLVKLLGSTYSKTVVWKLILCSYISWILSWNT